MKNAANMISFEKLFYTCSGMRIRSLIIFALSESDQAGL